MEMTPGWDLGPSASCRGHTPAQRLTAPSRRDVTSTPDRNSSPYSPAAHSLGKDLAKDHNQRRREEDGGEPPSAGDGVQKDGKCFVDDNVAEK
jgi:hypothetical protein